MPRPKKTEAVEVTPDAPKVRPKGQDAIVTVEVDTVSGKETRCYRVQGFSGNTLPWQRTGKGLDDILISGLQHGFGGQVTVEK
jgi:hypothetical protein